ncbi:hypothetical protein JYU34_004403 [Plutella xylostella]|uniref:FLYWCH-type domain-containing protein n=1 Tax=Plutella xylostella TaxID=51655 RepID=A0ABQ7QXW7_PLUXY|nr:hypothetical protein JYU34_004403 [Plutella xylostella]
MIRIGHYKFSAHRVRDLKVRWCCSSHMSKGCRACLYTYDDQIIKMNNDHSH